MRRHRGGKYNVWYTELLTKAHEYNEFAVPLNESEIRAIVKSIAKWVWQKDTDAETNFKLRQKEKGKKGGIAKGKANYNKRLSAFLLRESGMSFSRIAKELNVSATTIKRWFKF